jgi:hypothetical protein
MAAFYLAAGVVHLLAPDRFLPIVPDFVPMPREGRRPRVRAKVCASSVLPDPVGPISRMFDFASSISSCLV